MPCLLTGCRRLTRVKTDHVIEIPKEKKTEVKSPVDMVKHHRARENDGKDDKN